MRIELLEDRDNRLSLARPAFKEIGELGRTSDTRNVQRNYFGGEILTGSRSVRAEARRNNYKSPAKPKYGIMKPQTIRACKPAKK